jgi:hypothetical protein
LNRVAIERKTPLRRGILPVVLILSSHCALAQTAASPAPAVSPTPAPAEATAPGTAVILPANTVVELEMVDTITSKTSQSGDFFKLKIALPVQRDGIEIIPAGTPVVGQVVHAQAARGGGKAGELIVAARYIELPQGQIKLRSGFGAAGQDKTNEVAVAAVLIGVFSMMIKGKDLVLPAGHALSARLSADSAIQTTP